MTLRYQPIARAVTLTIPRRVPLRQGLSFVEDKRDWLAKQINAQAETVPFAAGQTLPVLGRVLTIRHVGGRGVVREVAGELQVPGAEEFTARRVRDWLRQQALATIEPMARALAAQLGKKPGRIQLRDTHSRWGSCSHRGDLSFSWRVVLAPPEVLHYLVCHEVAHLVEMNHSPRYWSLVAQLCPTYRTHKAWLTQHGGMLYAYGA